MSVIMMMRSIDTEDIQTFANNSGVSRWDKSDWLALQRCSFVGNQGATYNLKGSL